MEARMSEAIKSRSVAKMVDLAQEEFGLFDTLKYFFNQQMIDTYLEPGIVTAELVNPGPAPEAPTQLQGLAYKLVKEEHRDQAGRIIKFKSWVIAGLDDALEEIVAPGVSVSTISIKTIMARLQTEFNVRNGPLEEARDKVINAPIAAGQLFVNYAATKQKAWREKLQQEGIAVAEGERVRILIKGITGNDGKWTGGRETIQEIWNVNNATREHRTVARLVAAIKIHDESKPRETTAGAEFAGAAKTKAGEEEIFSLTKAEIRKMIAAEIRAREGANNNGGGGGKRQYQNRGGNNGGGGGGGNPGSGWTTKKPRDFFCSSHGYNPSHHSIDCMQKHPGHRDSETAEERSNRLPGDWRNKK